MHHPDPQRRHYLDIDASGKGFGAAVYMVKGDPDPIIKDGQAVHFPQQDVQVIMFLSKALTPAERNYWPTELEVGAMVWAMRKIRHFV